MRQPIYHDEYHEEMRNRVKDLYHNRGGKERANIRRLLKRHDGLRWLRWLRWMRWFWWMRWVNKYFYGDLGWFLCVPIPLGVGFCCDGCDGCDDCGVFMSPWPPSRPFFRKYFLLMMRVHTMNLCPYVPRPDPFLESFPSAYRCIYMMYILFYYFLLYNITI